MKRIKQFGGSFIKELWPVHRTELKKVILFFSLLFFVCMAYSMLRNIKDTLVLTGQGSGAAVIPFLKVWGILPAVFGATWLYTRLSRLFSKEAVFYLVIGGFVAFFLSFTVFMYPNLELLSIDRARFAAFPTGLNGFVSMVSNWPLSLFYIIAELWSVLLLGVVFWGFTNDIFGINEAKRTYGILNMGSNISPIAAGALAIFLTSKLAPLPQSVAVDVFHSNLLKLIGAVTICSIISVWLFWIINRELLQVPFRLFRLKAPVAAGLPKKKISMRASFKAISQSPYLLLLALIVLGYNISINFTDILWKEQLKTYFTDRSALLMHMNLVSFGTGAFAILGALFFSFFVHRLGWTFTAILTPLLMTVMAIGFFTCYFCGDRLAAFTLATFGLSPLAMTAYFGSWQNLLSKAGKYSVFDASKEIAFLPLPKDERRKGKAAIDGLGAGVGKSGASILYQGLLLAFGSVGATSPLIAATLMIVLSLWLGAVVLLGNRFKTLAVAEEGSVESERAPALAAQS